MLGLNSKIATFSLQREINEFRGEPLLAILHLGYGFVPLGFALAAGHALWPEAVPLAAVIHAWLMGRAERQIRQAVTSSTSMRS